VEQFGLRAAQSDEKSDAAASLPVGDYRAEGFDVSWEPGVVENELRSAAGSGAYRFHAFLDVMAGFGCMFGLLALLVSTAAVAKSWPLHWSFGLVFIGFMVLPFALRRTSIERRFEAAQRAVQMRFPVVVLVLRQMADSDDRASLSGLAFGIGHVKRHKAKGFEVLPVPEKRTS
jgi:hypothetical protein